MESAIPVSEAHVVFDAFNKIFVFRSPYITREPLKFLRAQLEASFPTKDIHKEGDGVYSRMSLLKISKKTCNEL